MISVTNQSERKKRDTSSWLILHQFIAIVWFYQFLKQTRGCRVKWFCRSTAFFSEINSHELNEFSNPRASINATAVNLEPSSIFFCSKQNLCFWPFYTSLPFVVLQVVLTYTDVGDMRFVSCTRCNIRECISTKRTSVFMLYPMYVCHSPVHWPGNTWTRW